MIIMERKVTCFTLCADTAQSSAAYLGQRLNCEIKNFGEVSAFAAEAVAHAAQGGFAVAAAPVDIFLNAKFRLLKSLSLKIVRSSQISAAMGENTPLNPKERDLQGAVAEKSKVFLTNDGLFSAFAVNIGSGTLVFAPLDASRLEYIFAAGLDAFMLAAPVQKKTKMQELRERVSNVIASGKTVAVSPCGSAKMLLSAISAVPDCDAAFIVDNAMRDKTDDESQSNYIAQCAKLSKENSSADLGIAISQIYSEGAGEMVTVCVADSERAKAAKVYANPGEDRKQLIVAAIIKLCQMLDELSAMPALVNPDAPKAATKKWAKNSKTPLIISVIGIAVAIIICVILAIVSSSKENKDSQTYAAGDYIQQEDAYFNNNDYIYEDYGGSILEGIEDEAVEVTPETTFSYITAPSTRIFTTKIRTTVRQTVTKITTTVKNTTKAAITTTTKVLTTIATTTKPTTTAKPSTTAAPTTTAKPATTVPTTVKPTSAAPVTEGVTTTTTASEVKGTFIFKVYGFGHGVGMSQEGAIQMAKNGDTYDKILTHYFTGTTIKTDTSTPLTIKYGGEDIPIVEYLCRTTKREIGASSPTEALKAQIVSAYTFAKYYNFDVPKSKHAYDAKYEYAGTNLHKACLAVLGMASDTDTPKAPYVDYNGKAAFTCYFASAAGKTASADSVWGGECEPYLTGGVSSCETVDSTTVEISAADMKKYIESYAKDNGYTITLGADPATWLEILSHDSAYNSSTGYVTQIRVGDKWIKKSDGKELVNSMRGNSFRSYLLDFKIRSHCFTFEYKPA